ncbi:MAG: sulfur carrier protein ThiS [Burkholderiaceae bacterium]
MSVAVNGQTRRLPGASTVLQLLTEFNIAGKRIAVERNGNIVPKSLHASTALADGDRLEIVVAVGGG